MTIFIAGIHGVGKTFLTVPAAKQLSLTHATASQLIRDERKTSSWKKNKQVDEVIENQVALIKAVNRIKNSGNKLLLDGHLVLRKSANQYEFLPETVFLDLGCCAIILLTCAAQIINNRLMKRGDFSWTMQELEEFAAAEFKHAKAVAHNLQIPFICLSEPSLDVLIQVLKRILQ